MTETIRVPDPVYERLKREAEQRDSPMGEVVRQWMNDSDELEQLREGSGRL